MGRPKGSDKQEGEAKKLEIIRLYNLKDRPTLEEIGKRVGNVSRQYVSIVLRRAGLLAQESEDVVVSDTISEIQKLTGWTLTDIGVIMDVARESVTRWSKGKPAAAAYARRLDLLAKGLRHGVFQSTKPHPNA